MKQPGLLSVFVLVMLAGSVGSYAQERGRIYGVISDSTNSERLPGANVHIEGTAIGTTSDLEGRYGLGGVPVGARTVVFSYVGYETKKVQVTVESGSTVNVDAELNMATLVGEELVVTAQLQGQAAAINQQITSNTISNVVSSEKIRELPDQNAAETVGRLPGVAVQRDAGEGTKVVVRGLSPKFNSITVNGERIPSTDAEDRSVDLSMISPDALAGIEVFKALTPDRDGDAVGGTVNLVTRRARKEQEVNFGLQSGYNNHEGELGQFKLSGSTGQRFQRDRFGVLVSGNWQRANRSSDLLDASYVFVREAREGEKRAVVGVENLNLNDRLETRDRFGIGLTLDGEWTRSTLVFNGFWSETRRNELQRRKRYRLGAARTEYEIRDRQINSRLLTNSLSGDHTLRGLDVDWRLSFSRTTQSVPFSHTGQFRELAAFNADLDENSGPDVIPDGAKSLLSQTFFKNGWYEELDVQDRDLTAQLNVSKLFRFGDQVSGFLKAGAKIRSKQRDRDVTEWRPGEFDVVFLARDYPDRWEMDRENRILISNFLLPASSVGEDFLDGRFDFGPVLDVGAINAFGEEFRDLYNLRADIDLEDYEAGERVTAQYGMAEVHFGKRVMLLPGVRVEQTRTDYSSLFGNPAAVGDESGGLFAAVDTSGSRSYTEVLPMLHVRVNPAKWFDIRLAATRSLSRPNYFSLVPWQRISTGEATVEEGNPGLKQTTAWNYDAFLSVYGWRGMVTAGWFYKTLDNIDFIRTTRIEEEGRTRGYQLTSPVNSAKETTIRGIEVEVQTNLKTLPSPWDGVVLYANYSHISSKTFFPLFQIGPRSPDPPFRPTIINTEREGRMPGQADNIVNVAIGYEKRGFSGRYSLVYQGKALQTVGARAELDGFSDAFLRQDLTVQQRLTDRTTFFFNANNINNVSEGAFLGSQVFPTQEEFFGWTGDLGLRFHF